MSKAIPIFALFIATLTASAALAADGESWAPWPFHHDEPAGRPDRVTALWNDAVATTAGQLPVRGFGGRLMFYETKNDTPVKIDGTLIVYAFDETNREPNNCKPDCKFVITPEQLPKHYSKCKAGHSYSVWIPWDKAGGMQKELTLIVRFEPKIGAPVIGEQLKEILPGLLPPSKFDASKLPALGALSGGLGNHPAANSYYPQAQTADGVRAVSYEQPVTQATLGQNAAIQGQGYGERRMKTSTIDVPDGLAIQQNLRAPAVAPPQTVFTHEKRYTNNPTASGSSQGYPPANAWPAANPSFQNHPAQGPAQGPALGPQMGQPLQGQPQSGQFQQQGQPYSPPQAGSERPRPWVPGEQFALPNRDRAPLQPRPAAPQYVPVSQYLGPNANAAPAATTGVQQ
jgi:hypothetical protein